MSKIFSIWSLLSAIHVSLAVLSMILGFDRLSAIIAGTIYLPLWPVSKLGLPVFQRNQWMIPPPNALGWFFIILFWAFSYWGLAVLLNHILQRRSHAA
jgi:hypothetical protein